MGKDPVQELMLSMGAMAEMVHGFHDGMIQAGASEKEATAAMCSFVTAFWHESMEDARRKEKLEEQGDEEA